MRPSRWRSSGPTVTGNAAKVVDASALACICFDEPAALHTARRLVGVPLFAPTLLDYEIANVCWVRLRRFPAAAAATMAQYAKRRSFPIARRDVAFDEVVALASATGLAVHDASYLWLSRSLGAELVTLDEKLARAAAQLH